MEILQQMIVGMLSRGEVSLSVSDAAMDHIGRRCLEVLEQISSIVADDTLDDPECFQRIERIICALENAGIDCGTRHDFG